MRKVREVKVSIADAFSQFSGYWFYSVCLSLYLFSTEEPTPTVYLIVVPLLVLKFEPRRFELCIWFYFYAISMRRNTQRRIEELVGCYTVFSTILWEYQYYSFDRCAFDSTTRAHVTVARMIVSKVFDLPPGTYVSAFSELSSNMGFHFCKQQSTKPKFLDT